MTPHTTYPVRSSHTTCRTEPSHTTCRAKPRQSTIPTTRVNASLPQRLTSPAPTPPTTLVNSGRTTNQYRPLNDQPVPSRSSTVRYTSSLTTRPARPYLNTQQNETNQASPEDYLPPATSPRMTPPSGTVPTCPICPSLTTCHPEPCPSDSPYPDPPRPRHPQSALHQPTRLALPTRTERLFTSRPPCSN